MAEKFQPEKPKSLPTKFIPVVHANLNDEGYYKRSEDAISLDDIFEIYTTDGKIAKILDMPVRVALSDIVDYTHPNPKAVEFVHQYVMNDVKYKEWAFNILSARWVGVSVSIVATAQSEGGLVVDDVFTIDPRFYIPNNGLGEKTITIKGTEGEVEVDRRNCIIYTHNATFSDPYGNSMLQAVLKAYRDKREIRQAWKLFERQYGMPIMIGRLPAGADQDEVNDLKQSLQDMSYGSKYVIRGGLVDGEKTQDLEIVSHNKTAGDFKDFNMLLDREIVTTLGGASILFNTEENGSYSLGAIHLKIFKMTVEECRNALQSIICGQIIQPLLIANFNELQTGSLVFRQLEGREFAEVAKGYSSLVQSQILSNQEPCIRRDLGLPLPSGTYDYNTANPAQGGVNVQTNTQNQQGANSGGGTVDGPQRTESQPNTAGAAKNSGSKQ